MTPSIIVPSHRRHQSSYKRERVKCEIVTVRKSKMSTNKRKAISLDTKLDIINRVESGEKQSEVAKRTGLPYSTVATIVSQSKKIKTSVQNTSDVSLKRITRTRSSIIEKMEKMLSVWIDDMGQRNMPVSQMTIQNKALNLFNFLKNQEAGELEETFAASRGWFEKFKNRSKIHSVRLTGEAASADIQAAAEFPQIFKTIVESGRYPPNLVFNFDETGLFWKRMPSKTFITQEERRAPGFKAAKDRLTLLLGANASGDFKLKPLLVYHSENPRAMKGFSKSNLPVIWKSSRKAWVTMSLFNDWFVNDFCTSVQRYCVQNNLEQKALLLIDNAPSHSKNLSALQTCIPVKIMFLPPNTTSIVQPMDQGVIAAFKAYYLRCTFSQLINAVDNQQIPIKEFWKTYDIMNAVTNIDQAWKAVSQHCLNAVWKTVWADAVENLEQSQLETDPVRDELVNMAQQLNFSEVDAEDVQALLDSYDDPLSNEELQELTEQNVVQDDADTDTDNNQEAPQQKILTTKILSDCLSAVSHSLEVLSENDPDFERSCTVKRNVLNALQCYSEMLQDKKKKAKQSTLNSFVNKD